MDMDKNFAAVLKLPLVKFAPTCSLGLAAGYYLPLPLRAALFAAAALAMLLPKLRGRKISLCSLGFAFGIALMSLYTALYYEPLRALSGSPLTAECLVTEVESARGDRAAYVVVTNVGGLPVRARLFGEDRADAGDRFEALIEISGADDIEYGAVLTGNIREFASVKRGFGVYGATAAVREGLSSLLRRNIGGDECALALSFLFGDKSLLTTELREAVTVSGAGHFTAVSGTHFTIFFAILLGLMAGKHKTARAVLSLVLIPVAVIFFGASASVIRSAVMLAICNCSPLLLRKTETLNSLCFAVAAMEIFSPAVVLNAGFQMSVLGVFGTAVVGERFCSELKTRLPVKKKLAHILKPVIISACAVVCTSPVAVGRFGGISLAGAFTSALLTPFIAAVMLFVLLAGITGMTAFLIPAAAALKAVRAVIVFVGGFRSLWLPMDFDGAVPLALLCAALISLAAISPKKLFEYGTGGFAALVLASLAICAVVRSARCKIDFIADGGSGAAVIVSGSTAVVLISGTGSGLDAALAERLRKSGVLEIECIVAPEMDSSGSAAVAAISRMLSVKAVRSPYYAEFPDRPAPESEIIPLSAEYVSVGGLTLSSADAGDESRAEDIVIYRGYKRSAPENGAGLAIYVSASQRELPENGINISEANFEMELESVGEIIIH